ncbi:MAG TPA: isocitrate lyase/phosphoenolpyruvate mutase family protein, partial [Burkholderiales bacterium]|nr:isocitrate lyase/phosphoenolpyruvate mutase family protein [Burkholderiales bacterium]
RDPRKPIYDFEHAVDRIAAAVAAARALPFPFVLVARAENYLHGRPDFEDTVRRLRAFAEAGADVLYAPGLRDLATIRRLVAAVPGPVNIVMGMIDPEITVGELAEAGVKRVSIGGALARRAYAAVRDAAISMRDAGSFRWVREAMPGKELNAIFEKYR